MKFLIKFSLFFVLSFSLLMGLVVSVDPYDKFGINFWNFKTKAVAQSRENKFILMESAKINYEVVLLGSSAAHRYPMGVLKDLTGRSAFNYSAQHTNPEDYFAILRHALDKNSVRMVLLQVDFGEMDKGQETSNQLYDSPLAKYLKKKKQSSVLFDYDYLTLKAIGDSLRVIYVNNWGEALHSNYRAHGDYVYEKPVPGPVAIAQASYDGWQMSQERLEYLAEIKKLCDSQGIDLIVFTAPLSYEHYQIASRHPGHGPFLQSLVEIFGEIWNFQHDSIKDYSTFEQFHDSTHLTQEFSAIVLRRLLAGLPEGLGERLVHSRMAGRSQTGYPSKK